MKLQALGQKDQESAGGDPSCLCHDQLVVDRDKGASDLVFADADALSDDHKEREKEPDHHPANLPVEKEVPSPEDGEYQGQPAADQEGDDRSENKSHDQGEPGMDVGETDVRDEPQSHGGHDQDAAREEKKQDEDSLFPLMVGLSFLRLFGPIGWCVVHLLPQHRPFGYGEATQKLLCRKPVPPRVL